MPRILLLVLASLRLVAGEADLAAEVVRLQREADPAGRLATAWKLLEQDQYTALAILPGPQPTPALRWAEADAALRCDQPDRARAALDAIPADDPQWGETARKARAGIGEAAALRCWDGLIDHLREYQRGVGGAALTMRFGAVAPGVDVAVHCRGVGEAEAELTVTGRGGVGRIRFAAGGVTAWIDGDAEGLRCATEVFLSPDLAFKPTGRTEATHGFTYNVMASTSPGPPLPKLVGDGAEHRRFARQVVWLPGDHGAWEAQSLHGAGMSRTIVLSADARSLRFGDGSVGPSIALERWDAAPPPAGWRTVPSAPQLVGEAFCRFIARTAPAEGRALAAQRALFAFRLITMAPILDPGSHRWGELRREAEAACRGGSADASDWTEWLLLCGDDRFEVMKLRELARARDDGAFAADLALTALALMRDQGNDTVADALADRVQLGRKGRLIQAIVAATQAASPPGPAARAALTAPLEPGDRFVSLALAMGELDERSRELLRRFHEGLAWPDATRLERAYAAKLAGLLDVADAAARWRAAFDAVARGAPPEQAAAPAGRDGF